jgi:hypothetical protein
MTDNQPHEYKSALRRAFVERRADYIVITSRREQFKAAAVSYGIDQGWLEGEWDRSDEQSTAFVARLTEAGRKHFGVEGR